MSDFIPSKIGNWYLGSETKLFTTLGSLLVVLANLGQFFLKPSGFPQGDSWAYGFGSKPSPQLISLTGHALRKWPIVLTNYLLGADSFRIGMQTLVSTIAWVLLLRECAKFQNNRKLAIFLVTCLAVSPQIVSWNSIQLSESYSISSGVLCVIFLRKYCNIANKSNLTGFSLSLLFFLNTKPSNFLAVFSIALLSTLLLARTKIRRLLLKHIKFLTVLILVIGYTALLTLNQSNEKLQADGHGESYAAAQAVAVISNINPYSVSVNTKLQLVQEYKCLGDVSSISPIEVTQTLKFRCPQTEDWLSHNFQKWYLKYIISNPYYAIKVGAVAFTVGNSPFSMYGGSLSITPEFLTDLFFGSRNFALRLTGDSAQNVDLSVLQVVSPILIWILLISIKAISYFLPRSKPNYIKSPSRDSKIAILSWIFGIFVILISALSIPNEWFRQSIVGQVFIFLGGILLLSNHKFSEKPTIAQ